MEGVPGIGSVDILIVRGASDTDDLQAMGLPMAERFANADSVILVKERARVVKGATATVSFIDADSRLDVVARTLDRIRGAYEETHEDDRHLSHAFVGRFLFYCVVDDGRPMPVPVIEVIREGDISSFERAAEEYISGDFSEHLLCASAKFPSNDAGGSDSEADLQAASIHGPGGDGKAISRDR